MKILTCIQITRNRNNFAGQFFIRENKLTTEQVL